MNYIISRQFHDDHKKVNITTRRDIDVKYSMR